MDFQRLASGQLLVSGHDHTPSQIRAAIPGHLVAEGMDTWTAEEVAPTARLARMWHSDTAGFTHDCTLHAGADEVPGCADSRPVTVVVM